MADATADIKILVKDVEGVLQSINRIEKKIQGMGRASYNASRQMVKANKEAISSFEAMGNSISNARRKVLAIGTAAVAVTVVVREISKLQALLLQLNNISDGPTDLAKNLDLVREVSVATGTSFKENSTLLARYTRALERYGGTARQASIVIDTLNKAFLVNGTTGSEATSVLVQLSQALTAGALSGDEFRSFAENAGSLVDGLAKTMGVSVNELKKLGAQGKITADIVIQTAVRMNKEFSDLAKNQEDLPLDRQFQNLVTEMEYAIVNSEILKQAFAGLGKLVKALWDDSGLILFGAALAGLVAYFPAILAGLTALGTAISTVTTLSLAFIATPMGAVMLALGVALTIVTKNYLDNEAAAAAAAAATAELRKEMEILTFKYNTFASKESLQKLVDLKVAMSENVRIAKLWVEELKRLQKEDSLFNTNAIIHAKLQIALGEKNLKIMRAQAAEIEKAAERNAKFAAITDIFTEAKSQQESAQKDLDTALGKKLTNLETTTKKYAGLFTELNNKITELGNLPKDAIVAYNKNLLAEFEKAKEIAIAMDALEAKKPKEAKAKIISEDPFKQMLLDATNALSIAEKVNAAVQSGINGPALELLTQRFEVEKQIQELREKGTKATDPEIASLQEKLDLINSLGFATKTELDLQQAQIEGAKALAEATESAITAQYNLSLIGKGYSEEQITYLKALNLLQVEYNKNLELYGEIKAKAILAQQTLALNATVEAESLNKQLSANQKMWQDIGEAATDTLISIIDGSRSAGEALRALLLQLLELIAKAYLLKVLTAASGAVGAGSAAGGVQLQTTGLAVNVFNYSNTSGGIQTRANNSGGVDVFIGQVANAINRGGNPLDSALRRTYGIGRIGS